jgi:hypothetical protein
VRGRRAPGQGTVRQYAGDIRAFLDTGLPNSTPPRQEEQPVPREVLPSGTELDAYGPTDRPFLFTIGTPFASRGLYGTADAHAYHVYRVVEPLEVFPGLFADTPIFPTGQRDGTGQPARGRGFYVVDSIDELVRAGLLVEITGPGGEPVGGTPGGSTDGAPGRGSG